jgi:putative FmdB family regulatory protein
MPVYEYRCSSCDYTFENLKPISDRDAPCSEPCPSCAKKEVRRDWTSAPAAAVDMNLTPGQDFKEVMKKVAKGAPKRFRENLERSASRRGTVWGNG